MQPRRRRGNCAFAGGKHCLVVDAIALLSLALGVRGHHGAQPHDDDTLHGWTIGGGVDYAVTDRVFTRLEYRYNDFGSGTLGGSDVDFNQHVVNVGLAVKF